MAAAAAAVAVAAGGGGLRLITAHHHHIVVWTGTGGWGGDGSLPPHEEEVVTQLYYYSTNNCVSKSFTLQTNKSVVELTPNLSPALSTQHVLIWFVLSLVPSSPVCRPLVLAGRACAHR